MLQAGVEHLAWESKIQSRFEEAARRFTPEWVAWHFGDQIGQFYDRERFDDLARLVRDFYAERDKRAAKLFRQLVDEYVTDRGYPRGNWAG